MSEAEVLIIPVSLILGLGVTQILSGFIRSVRHREQTRRHWLPIVWGVAILGYDVGYFNVLYDVSVSFSDWTWGVYGPVLLQSMLLFFSSGLIFPGESGSHANDMLTDFERHGRLALVPLALLLASAPIFNWLNAATDWLDPANLNNVALTVLILPSIVNRRGALRSASTLLFFLFTVLGWLFWWAQPGTAT